MWLESPLRITAELKMHLNMKNNNSELVQMIPEELSQNWFEEV